MLTGPYHAWSTLMDTSTGRIHTDEEVRAMSAEDRARIIRMSLAPTPLQSRMGRAGRNDPCPCGSGRKFKHCHLSVRTPVEEQTTLATPEVLRARDRELKRKVREAEREVERALLTAAKSPPPSAE